MNRLARDGVSHSSKSPSTPKSFSASTHRVHIGDVLEGLASVADSTVRLIVCDPPYNLKLAKWDSHEKYVDWASRWVAEFDRVLLPEGSVVVFGGLQFQGESGGDLLELMHHIRHHMPWRLVNLIVWHYANGMSAHRFFANRHEEIAWFAKSAKYVFNLDAVREPYNDATRLAYLKDKRLRPESVNKGRNPTNVWQIPRLNGNSKERTGHPTQKPQALIRRLLLALSNPGDVVLDPFAGSGVTGRVAKELDRSSILIDRDPIPGT